MMEVLFWVVLALVLLIVVPDCREARREIARRQSGPKSRAGAHGQLRGAAGMAARSSRADT